jgi:hypothetical protein
MNKPSQIAPNKFRYFNRFFGILGAAIIAVPAYGAPHATPRPNARPQPTPLPLTVAAALVQQAIAIYQTSDSGPKLDSADLTFKVTSGTSEGVGFTFWIFTFGVTATQTEMEQVTFSYKVPAPAKPVGSPSATPTGAVASPTPANTIATLSPEIREQEAEKFAQGLDINSLAAISSNELAEKVGPSRRGPSPNVTEFQKKLIAAIRDAAMAAKRVKKLGIAEFQSFTVQIDYTVKIEGSASGNIPVLTVLSIGPKGTMNHETAHSIKLVFNGEQQPISH